MSKPELRTISAEATIPVADDASVSEMVLIARVGEIPSASISYHSGEKVQDVMSSDVMSAMASQQELMFTTRTEPDVELSVDDGEEGLEFRGFMTAPVIEAGTGKFAKKIAVVGETALMTSLDLSIYNYGPQDFVSDRALLMKDFRAGNPNDPGDLGSIIKDMTEAAISNYEATRLSTPEGIPQAVLRQKHRVNRAAVDAFYEILDNSDLEFEDWGAFSQLEQLRITFLEKIRHILQMQSNGFWPVIQTLMQEFQLLYIPEWDGNGKLVRADQRSLGKAEDRELQITQLQTHAGGSEVLPLAAVVVRGPVLEYVPDRDNPAASVAGRSRILSSYPTNFRAGRIQEVHLPSWLREDKSVAQFLASTAVASAVPKLNLDKAGNELKEQDEKSKAGGRTVGDKILTNFARVMYEDLKYANSTASARVPMDLSWEVGKRYNLSFSSGGSFSAFLHSVRHSLSLSDGRQMNSATHLQFTHVKF